MSEVQQGSAMKNLRVQIIDILQCYDKSDEDEVTAALDALADIRRACGGPYPLEEPRLTFEKQIEAFRADVLLHVDALNKRLDQVEATARTASKRLEQVEAIARTASVASETLSTMTELSRVILTRIAVI